MSDATARAQAALELWDNTCGVAIEVTDGMVGAEDAYRTAPKLVRELVAELETTRAQRDRAIAEVASCYGKIAGLLESDSALRRELFELRRSVDSQLDQIRQQVNPRADR